MVETVPLGRGFTALISPEDAERILCVKWFVTQPSGQKRYAIRQEREGGRRRTVYLHRRIIGAAPGQIVDHINGDGLDNRRENLRLATPSQNSANRSSYSPTSGYRGVYAHRRLWLAMISVNNKNIRLGRFSDPVEAARAYDAAALAHFGEFAQLNFAAEV